MKATLCDHYEKKMYMDYILWNKYTQNNVSGNTIGLGWCFYVCEISHTMHPLRLRHEVKVMNINT